MPFFFQQDERGDASRKVNSFFVVQNADWSSELNIRLKIIYTYQLLDKVVTSPSSYGFNNVTHGYWDVCTGTCTDNENDYLWWDAGHLTGGKSGHKLIANEIINAAPFDVEGYEVDDLNYVKDALSVSNTKLKSDVYEAKAATGRLDNAPQKENESTASTRLTSIMASVTTRYTSRGRFVPLRDLESSRE
ncbi:hypothetical protein BGW37DRAFT_431871 [Umbelopsis sp. PMI_123]|nr:hypothetical protein BGW37DRAFT_431871 [Umbelopsis sp. PMI_123]